MCFLEALILLQKRSLGGGKEWKWPHTAPEPVLADLVFFPWKELTFCSQGVNSWLVISLHILLGREMPIVVVRQKHGNQCPNPDHSPQIPQTTKPCPLCLKSASLAGFLPCSTLISLLDDFFSLLMLSLLPFLSTLQSVPHTSKI